MSAEPPPNLPPRKRLDIERPLGGNAAARRGIIVYAVITLVLVGLAVHNAAIEQLPLTSPYVAAPAIGALWFALRLFMIWGAR